LIATLIFTNQLFHRNIFPKKIAGNVIWRKHGAKSILIIQKPVLSFQVRTKKPIAGHVILIKINHTTNNKNLPDCQRIVQIATQITIINSSIKTVLQTAQGAMLQQIGPKAYSTMTILLLNLMGNMQAWLVTNVINQRRIKSLFNIK
jgi:hypothetical protein